MQVIETFTDDDSAEEDASLHSKPDLITHVAGDQLTMHD